MPLADGLRPRWAMAFAGSPWFAGLTAASAAVVGLLGSVYQDEIANAFPLTLIGPFSGWSGRAVAFWTALAALVWLVYLRQVADDSVRNRLVTTTESAEQTSRRIEEFTQTLPPAGFQAHLTMQIDRSHQSTSEVMPRRLREEVPAQELVPMIRALLHGLASPALAYDDSPLVDAQQAVYAANVMVFVPQPSAANLHLTFFPAEQSKSQLLGALLLRQDLSATSERVAGDTVSTDTTVPAIALPVPQMAERNGLWVALLGGPRAFLTGHVDGYVDTSIFADECARRGDFQPSVLAELRHYFSDGPGGHIRSFVSRQLVTGGQPIGVLNIHANRRDLLGPRLEKRETFHALATPLVQDLADVLGLLMASEGPLPIATSNVTMSS